MKEKRLQVVTRTEFKKGAAGRLRREGMIPAVIYGHEKTRPITVNRREFANTFHTISENTIVTLKDEKGDETDVLVKDFQQDPLSRHILHLDFYEVVKGKTLRTHIPVKLTGSSIGVREGGMIEQITEELEVECLPRDLPEFIEVGIDDLGIGDSIHIEDLALGKELKFHDFPAQVIVHVVRPKDTTLSEAEEGAGAGSEE